MSAIDATVLPLAVALLVGLAAGFAAGLAFFVGLRMTVDRLPSARRPGTMFLASLVLRMALAAGVLFALARWTDWPGVLAGAIGMIAARSMLLRRPPPGVEPNPETRR